MNQTKWLILLIIGIVFLSGCVGGSRSNSSTNSERVSSSGISLAACLGECDAPSFPEAARGLCYQACYSNEAKGTRNPNVCDPLEERYNLTLSYQVCLEDVGTTIRSSQPCTKLKDEDLRAVCVSNVAMFTRDSNICNNIAHSSRTEYYRGVCFRDVERERREG